MLACEACEAVLPRAIEQSLNIEETLNITQSAGKQEPLKKGNAASNRYQWRENSSKLLGMLLNVLNYNYVLPGLCIEVNELERNKGISGNKQSPQTVQVVGVKPYWK